MDQRRSSPTYWPRQPQRGPVHGVAVGRVCRTRRDFLTRLHKRATFASLRYYVSPYAPLLANILLDAAAAGGLLYPSPALEAPIRSCAASGSTLPRAPLQRSGSSTARCYSPS